MAVRRKSAHPLCLDEHFAYRLNVASSEVSRMNSRAYQARFGLAVPE